MTKRVLGLDPGLLHTGWGVIDVDGPRLRYVDAGECPSGSGSLPARLASLAVQIKEVIEQHQPEEVAVEETYVNRNPRTTLLLGHARAVSLVVPGQAGLPLAEYAPAEVKKAIVGGGRATKEQVSYMVRALLRGCPKLGEHAMDALATAICHAGYSRPALAGRTGRVARKAVPGAAAS